VARPSWSQLPLHQAGRIPLTAGGGIGEIAAPTQA